MHENNIVIITKQSSINCIFYHILPRVYSLFDMHYKEHIQRSHKERYVDIKPILGTEGHTQARSWKPLLKSQKGLSRLD